jgi:hypothetical protein
VNVIPIWFEQQKNFETLRNQERPEFIIEGILPESSICFVLGSPGSAKSFLSQSWAASIATGKPWLGREVKQGAVLYIVAEATPQSILDRFDAWTKHNETQINFEEALRYVDGFDLSNKTQIENIHKGSTWEGLRLVVLDSLTSGAGEGLDLNNRTEASAVVTFAQRIVRESQGKTSVLIVAHSPKNDPNTISGSIALDGIADLKYRMRKSGGRYLLDTLKSKNGREDFELRMRLDEVELQEDLKSAVLVSDDGSGIDLGRAMEALKAFNGVSEGDWISNRDFIKNSGQSETTAIRSRDALVTSNRLQVEGEGRNRRLRLIIPNTKHQDTKSHQAPLAEDSFISTTSSTKTPLLEGLVSGGNVAQTETDLF